MSHVVTMEVRVRDLEALKAAAAECGLEFREGQRTYRWYGQYVGDYNGTDAAYRQNVRPEEYGRNADHALAVTGSAAAYEVGVVRAPDGDGYLLAWDNWMGGKGLADKIGQHGNCLQAAYSKHAVLNACASAGYSVVSQEVLPDGRLHIRAQA